MRLYRIGFYKPDTIRWQVPYAPVDDLILFITRYAQKQCYVESIL